MSKEFSETLDRFDAYFRSANGVPPNARISVPTAEWEELRAGILEQSKTAARYDHLQPYLCKTCGGYGLVDRRSFDDPLGAEDCPDCNAVALRRKPLGPYGLKKLIDRLSAQHESWNFGDLVKAVEVHHGIGETEHEQ